MKVPQHCLLDFVIAAAELKRLREEKERAFEEGRRVYVDIPLDFPRDHPSEPPVIEEPNSVIWIPLVDPSKED